MSRCRFWLGAFLGVATIVTTTGCLSQYRGFILPIAPSIPSPIVAADSFGAEWVLLYPWMPVSPALSWEVEEAIERHHKEGVPIMDPIQGDAPVFCMDPPSDEMVYKTLPPIPHGLPFVWEVQRNNVRIAKEKIVDQIDDCKVYPLVGPCQLHHCHFKCTVWYDETTTMCWPVPWTYTDHKQEVLYIDVDHLHRCGNPGQLADAAGPAGTSRY